MSDLEVPPPDPEPPRPLATLEAEAAERDPPTFTGTVGVAGGLLVATSVFVFVDELPDDGTRVGGILLSAVLLAAGMVARLRYGTGPIGKAGVAATAVAVLPLVVLVVLGTEDPPDKSDVTIVLVLGALVFGALYLVGPSRGATVLLALGLFTLWQVAVVQTFPDEPAGGVEVVQELGGFETIDEEFDPNQFGLVSLLVGAVLALAGYALDRRRVHASATAFFLVGDLALLTGIIAVGVDAGAITAGILSIGAGATLAFLGSEADRRFTTWLGGFGVLAGLSILIDEAVDDNGILAGFVLLAVGAAIVAAAHVIAPRLGEGEQTLTPPEPPPTPAP